MHREIEEQEEKERHKQYKQQRNDKTEQSFYKSKAWQKIRDLRLSFDHGLCQQCYKEKKITRATMVHHKVEVKQDWSKRLDVDNLESLCEGCHNKVHGK